MCEQQTEERVKHSPCPQTVHAWRGERSVNKNSVMLKSALGEPSPCAMEHREQSN